MSSTSAQDRISSTWDHVRETWSRLPTRNPVSLIRRGVGKVLKFKPRTRNILTFIGSIAILSSWVLPWYNNLYWISEKSAKANAVAPRNGYEFTNVSPSDYLARWGLNIWTDHLNGSTLAHGSPLMRSLSFSEREFYWWMALALVSLVSVKTFEWGQSGDRIRKLLAHFVDNAKAVALVVVIAQCVWKAGNLASLAKIEAAAQATFLSRMNAEGVKASALTHMTTTFSIGFEVLIFGLIFAFLGVFSDDREPKDKPGAAVVEASGDAAGVETPQKIRVRVRVIVYLALAYLVLTYTFFH